MRDVSQGQDFNFITFMSFIFFGSGYFAKLVLENLFNQNIKPNLIITAPPKPKGRKKIISPNEIELLAKQKNIPVLTPTSLKDDQFIIDLSNFNPQLAVLTDYGKIVPANILKIPEKGFLNIHPSLLPRWRGASPIQSTILEGDGTTGVTIILMNEKIDEGLILSQKKIKTDILEINYQELLEQLANLGTELLIQTMPKWLKNEINPLPQDDSLATYCSKFNQQNGKIDWNKSAEIIERQVRALNPEPGIYTYFSSKNNSKDKSQDILKILKAKKDLTNNFSELEIGKVFLNKDNKISAKCGQGFLILEIIQPAGKKAMQADNFLKGNKWIIGTILN